MPRRPAVSKTGSSSGSSTGHPGAAPVAHVDAEVLEELQARGSRRHVPLELRGRALAEAGADAAAEIEIGEADHPARLAALGDRIHATLQRAAGAAAQVDENGEVQRVHLAGDLVQPPGGETGPVVAVHVDDGEPRPRHRVGLDHEGSSAACSPPRAAPARRSAAPGFAAPAPRSPTRPLRAPAAHPRSQPIVVACHLRAAARSGGGTVHGPPDAASWMRREGFRRSRRVSRILYRVRTRDERIVTRWRPFLWPRRRRRDRATYPGGFGRAVLWRLPIWSCSVRGLACRPPCGGRGALLPHLFTLTARQARGGMFSVPLSFRSPRPGVTRRTALRSSDFPPRPIAAEAAPDAAAARPTAAECQRTLPSAVALLADAVLLQLLVEITTGRVDLLGGAGDVPVEFP